MRYLKIGKDELCEIERMYKLVMSSASKGLLFKKGEAIGRVLSKSLSEDAFFDEAVNLLKDRGWVEDIEFNEDSVVVRGSFERSKNASEPSCHILRGILRSLYSHIYMSSVYVDEVECESINGEKCVFHVNRVM